MNKFGNQSTLSWPTQFNSIAYNRLKPVWQQSWQWGVLLRRTRRFFCSGRDRGQYQYISAGIYGLLVNKLLYVQWKKIKMASTT